MADDNTNDDQQPPKSAFSAADDMAKEIKDKIDSSASDGDQPDPEAEAKRHEENKAQGML